MLCSFLGVACAMCYISGNSTQAISLAFVRILLTRLYMTLHYVAVDKNHTLDVLTKKQIDRERSGYPVGIVMHMMVHVVLLGLFPNMFLETDKNAGVSILTTLIVHILFVEPLYYWVHRWLHLPAQLKAMHQHHHSSVKTVPSTSLVQNFEEHFLYVAVFGPAMIFPYFLLGYNHRVVVAAYLLLFDACNAFGHTNLKCRGWLWDHPWSPMRYMFYTPEFHLGHHAYYNCNFALFMPLWDHLLGTYRPYHAPTPNPLLSQGPDFVFIGHNGGLGHYFTIPEFCFYHIYDQYYRTVLPLEVELLLAHWLNQLLRCFFVSYSLPKYVVDGEYVSAVVCLMRTPMDYFRPQCYGDINHEMLALIRRQFTAHGTRYFGLGNLNKMKQLNDGGLALTRMVSACPRLKEKGIRIWTGDTLTVGSIVNQLASIRDLREVLYIGAGGKIGTVVCALLAQRDIKVCVYTENMRDNGGESPTDVQGNITYTSDLAELLKFQYVLIGKNLPTQLRSKIECVCRLSPLPHVLLDYSVPFVPLQLPRKEDGSSAPLIHHVQIGVLKVTGDSFLKGYYDICMGLDQGHIYPCHAGCLLNLVTKRETDETGPIDLAQVGKLWIIANSCGLDNKLLVL